MIDLNFTIIIQLAVVLSLMVILSQVAFKPFLNCVIMPIMKFLYQFGILKKWRQRICLGSGARPERAGSIGWASPCLRG